MTELDTITDGDVYLRELEGYVRTLETETEHLGCQRRAR
jgi:hypothetical protein